MSDSIQRAIIEEINCRCIIVRLDTALDTLLTNHDYPDPVKRFLSTCVAASTLLSVSLKYRGQLTLQMQSEGPLKLLVAKCDDQLNIRGLARFEPSATAEELTAAMNQGRLIVTIQNDETAKTYQSVIALNGGLIQGLEDYFLQSEQINTKLNFHTEKNQCFGIMCQALPVQSATMTLLPNHLPVTNLVTQSNAEFLVENFSAYNIRQLDTQSVQYHCPCSRERSLSSVQLMSVEEIDDYFSEHPYIVVTCDYCNKEYSFNRDEIITS